MSPSPSRAPAALVAVLLLSIGGAAGAAQPQVPWADPIGTSPPLGAAPGSPSVPYAEPIGASRLNPAPRVAPRSAPAPSARRCYRVLDAGRIVTRCTLLR